MMEDSKHALWMGSYGGGLVRFKDGKFTQYTYKDGLFDNVVYELVEDNHGYLWLGGMKGIGCVKKQMLVDFADGKIDHIQCTKYSAADGMVSSNCAGNMQSGACKTLDGHLWFATNGGIVVVDPDDLQENRLPPPVMIEKIVVNKIEYSSRQDVHVSVSEGQVDFQYSGLSYRVPGKVQFRYMLDGFDKEWKSVGTRRAAYYTNLSPGKYIFRVTACNNDGLWNETGASFAFELEPHFYQTSWFYGFVLIAIAGMIYGMYRIRVWRLVVREKILKNMLMKQWQRLRSLLVLFLFVPNARKSAMIKGTGTNWKNTSTNTLKQALAMVFALSAQKKCLVGFFEKQSNSPENLHLNFLHQIH